MRLLDYFLRGGPLMWPLLVCSVAAAAIVIERWLVLRQAPGDAAPILTALQEATDDGLVEAGAAHGLAVKLLVAAAVAHRGQTAARLTEVLDTLGNELVQQMQGPVDWLRAIAEVAPLLGFLGTVVGMVGAFDAVTQHGLTTPAVVSGGVSAALICSAGGLLVAVPALLCHHGFSTRLDRIAGALERVAQELVDRLAREATA